jgi:hypothetical protein
MKIKLKQNYNLHNSPVFVYKTFCPGGFQTQIFCSRGRCDNHRTISPVEDFELKKMLLL